MKKTQYSLKKQPLQKRSVFLVNSIKEAATRILKEKGLEGFNTNVVAEYAGVSIGSLYQYFDCKETLIAEIKREHFAQLRGFFREAQENLVTNDLKELVDAFIEASVKGHQVDPILHKVLSQDLVDFGLKEKDNPDGSILSNVKAALLAYQNQLRPNLDITTAAELVYYLVEKTVHEAIINEQESTKQLAIISELKKVVLSYLRDD
ncbi:TetR/AcrR family transcriptional regulator [Marinibactrum halimedae]|uniref:TetR family transcriptional regulator n=1 Tax=Marinibactrum halimedae TaxID=1444977 RepID=A0AA37WM07_9GAMM|nr:TetR/AcrR family transcriptional regulator [Marinibactrum halimedae]MCD9461033.1 TetR/AcrR family transcriptional regulator [Marinibactrum halimedae]GLS24411.1 TetR family transcriptional regulator [Marinibactrum halimedae]